MSFQCNVVSPEKELYSGEAEMVVLPGFEDGQVGFLSHHCPYIGALGCGRLRIREAGGAEHHWVVYRGFVEFSNNRLTVLASQSEKPEDITEEMVRQDREEIPQLPSRTLAEYDEKQRRMSMLKARVLVLGAR